MSQCHGIHGGPLELEKNKYQRLKIQLQRAWKIKRVKVVPIVIGTLETIPKGLKTNVEGLGIVCDVKYSTHNEESSVHLELNRRRNEGEKGLFSGS